MAEKQGIEHILERNQFYLSNYRLFGFSIFILFLLIFGLVGFSIYQWLTPPPPVYFATTPDGRPIPLIPLNEQLHPADFVLEWAKRAVIATYSLDFVSYRESLQQAEVYFTWQGHVDFMEAYRISNNLDAIRERKQVVSAEIRGPGQVTSEGLNEEGIYAWGLTIPVTFIYQNSEGEVIRQIGRTVLKIQRDSLLRHPDGIAIAQLVFNAE